MIRAHRIRLNPTPSQEIYFRKAAGIRRLAYNWGLEQWQRQYKAGEKPSALKLKKQFNAIKREQFPFVYEVTKCAAACAFFDLHDAFQRFFKGLAKYPRFKSKKRSQDSFGVDNDKFIVGPYWIKLPHIGKVNMAEKLRFKGKILSARITRSADWWFVSIVVEMPDKKPAPLPDEIVGIDLGLNRLATLSDGSEFENQKPLRSNLNQLKQLQRSLSRKQKGSKNSEQARRKVARMHYRIGCLREDALQKLTTQLTTRYRVIVIEDLNVKGMLRNHKLALSLSDAALGRFEELLKEKAEITGARIIQVDRFFPSSKKCHVCGHVKEDLNRSERVYHCTNPKCGITCDRDYNASLNLRREGLRLLGVPEHLRHGSSYDGR